MILASIVVYKSDKKELCAVVECVEKSSIEKLIVVDNSPTDDLRDFCLALSSKVDYVFGQGNVGYGAAHNIAINMAVELGAKYHVVINPDIIFELGTIEKLAEYMDSDDTIGQLMPKIFYPNGDIQRLCKLLPTPMDLIGRKFLPSGLTKKRNARFEMQSFDYNHIMDIPFLSGCFMFLRVDALRMTNGFDDNIFMYCEDIDLCRRIKEVGYRTVFYPLASVVHCHKQESYVNKTLLRAHIKSALYYFNKWGWLFDKNRKRLNRATTKELKG